MRLPALVNSLVPQLGLRCSCGDEIEIRVHEDNAGNGHVCMMRVHDKQYAFRTGGLQETDFRYDGPGWIVEQLRRGERDLARVCPCSAVTFGEVADAEYERVEYELPGGRRVSRMARRIRQPARDPGPILYEWQGLPPVPAPKPTAPKPPTAPAVRKILL
jgi:hypothetical protein